MWVMLALACSLTVVKRGDVVVPETSLSAEEARALAGARISCGVRYPRSPCVAEFRVTGVRSYKVICAAEKETL